MPAHQKFQYRSSLCSDDIRLLIPISASQNALHFQIQETPRFLKPSYTAVSYTWGNEEASEVIYLDKQPFPVRPNLWSCLYYLSRSPNGTGLQYLWVDAICINQGDDAERNAQVRAMDQTYRNAALVSVWLGLVPIPEAYEALVSQQPRVKTLEMDPFDWDYWMNDLANRSYWSRFWVIQEFSLGQNILIHCSNNILDCDTFQFILCRKARVSQYSLDYDGTTTNGFLALPLVMGRHPDKHPKLYQPFDTLLANYHNFECKDPRDRVFSLLGLTDPEERAMLGRFFPDYTLSEDHVRIVALAHVTQYGPLVVRVRINNHDAAKSISDELFLGLGVDSQTQRLRLLRRARKLDYIGFESLPQLRDVLVSHDLDEELGILDNDHENELNLVQNDETLESQSWACFWRGTKRALISLAGIVAVAVLLGWKFAYNTL